MLQVQHALRVVGQFELHFISQKPGFHQNLQLAKVFYDFVDLKRLVNPLGTLVNQIPQSRSVRNLVLPAWTPAYRSQSEEIRPNTRLEGHVDRVVVLVIHNFNLQPLSLLLGLLALEHACILRLGYEEVLDGPELEAILGVWEQEEAAEEQQDLEDTTQVAEQVKDVVGVSLVLLLHFVEGHHHRVDGVGLHVVTVL